MAIPEACGLWIEQRVQEELDSKGETGASLREIGRKLSAEVEKYFEVKMKPETIRKRAERQGGTNVPKPRKISQKMAWGKAIRDLKKVRSYITKNCMTDADIHFRTICEFNFEMEVLKKISAGLEWWKQKRKPLDFEPIQTNQFTDFDLDSLPMRYTRMAILDLEKIEKSHPDKNKAFDYVIEWINKNR